MDKRQWTNDSGLIRPELTQLAQQFVDPQTDPQSIARQVCRERKSSIASPMSGSWRRNTRHEAGYDGGRGYRHIDEYLQEDGYMHEDGYRHNDGYLHEDGYLHGCRNAQGNYANRQHKPTPCSPAELAQRNFATLSACVSECQHGVQDNNACTTHTVHALAGSGRACAAGEMGQDAQGNCLASFGEAKQAYDFFASACTSGGAAQNEQCAAAASAVLRLQPGLLDTTSDDYVRACPEGRMACAQSRNGVVANGCVEWCAGAGVPEGVPVCSADGTKADGMRGRFVSSTFANVSRDPASRNYEPAMAEIAKHFDKQCRDAARGRHAHDRHRHAHDRVVNHNTGPIHRGAQQQGQRDAVDMPYYSPAHIARQVNPRSPLETQLEQGRRMQCASPINGSRNLRCEADVDVRADRELLEALAIRQVGSSGRSSGLRSSGRSSGLRSSGRSSKLRASKPRSYRRSSADLSRETQSSGDAAPAQIWTHLNATDHTAHNTITLASFGTI